MSSDCPPEAPIKPLQVEIAELFRPVFAGLKAGPVPLTLGLRRSARLPAVAALYSQRNEPLLLVTDRADRALVLFDELSLWLPDAPRLLVPEPNPLYYENEPWAETTRRDRLLALTRLAAYHLPGAPRPESAPILVASARAVMTRTLPRREFLKATQRLRPGQAVAPDELAHRLVELGYRRVNTVIAPGQYTRRGGLLDLWPPDAPQPTRVEFFGDEIDTLRYFVPSTQRTVQAHQYLLVPPAREFLLPTEPDRLPPDLPREVLPEDINEFFIPRLHTAPASLIEYLPRNGLILVDDLQSLAESVHEIEESAVKFRQEAEQIGALLPDFPLPYLTWGEIADTLPRYPALELGASHRILAQISAVETQTESLPDAPAPETLLDLAERFQPGPRFGGRLKAFIDHLRERVEAGDRVYLISRQATRLCELWQETRERDPARANEPQFLSGSLAEGWTLALPDQPPRQLFTDGEIFGWRRPEPRQRARQVAEAPESSYADLQPGDFVVHADHGIGVFVGLVNRTISSIEREYLCIEYADEAQVFVPVHQADRVTRYIGPDGRAPSLSRLGGVEWRNTKTVVKEAVQEVAEDLLELYAKRNVIQGYAFAPDSPWQQELEASFPYIETDDQTRVLLEVKRDMERQRPMDRLICGDVGYGKTEVALRAAFKAVLDGKQVAMLVPTTVLAQQHFQTFRQRLAAFPAEVEMLSRFRTPQQQREILHRLRDGAVDIIIGTHRLLSGDVEFKDLGLLIIDEEQRFGVTHKERLKRMRTEVDVLTLTATPIPRTLYMALTGVRDISTINTPPEERLPIVTYVGPFSPRLVRQAILRELERGGQVFFVHNRVQTIGAMRQHLEKLVPEARVIIGHGQMPEDQLARHMRVFARGEVDVLLCTSIIESGLDIPNANTLIVDRADTFGLAQLYQLRGRVGRGAQRAYAYFFRHAKRQPTIEGLQRLETIAENTQLGAGFSIAMRDLEIRGAGDLLGTRQHGHIAAVGFHLYTQLLGAAVKRLKRSGELPFAAQLPALVSSPALPINIDLPLAASIPADYVADKSMRLRLYRRISDVRKPEEADQLREEFKDRFGPLPEAVENLLLQIRLKLLAQQAGLGSISTENGQMVLRFPDGDIPERLPRLGPWVRVGKTALWLPYRHLEDWLATLVEVLETLAAPTHRVGHHAQPDTASQPSPG